MIYNKIKKTLSVAVSLSLITNLSPQVYASDLIAIPQNNSSVVIPQNPSIIQYNSTEFSMKTIESKMNNILKPDKKGEINNVNRKVLDASGSCRTGVTYTFTASTGKLTISGS